MHGYLSVYGCMTEVCVGRQGMRCVPPTHELGSPIMFCLVPLSWSLGYHVHQCRGAYVCMSCDVLYMCMYKAWVGTSVVRYVMIYLRMYMQTLLMYVCPYVCMCFPMYVCTVATTLQVCACTCSVSLGI